MERRRQDDGAGDVGPIARSLRGLRRLARALLAVDAVALVLIAVVASAVAVGLFDYVFVTPIGLRLAVWAGGIVATGLALWRLLRPAAMFRPSLPDLALRVERTPEGEQRGLRGVLASGLEFSRALPREADGDATSAALARFVVREAASRFSPSLVFGVLRPRRPLARLGTLAGVAAVVGVMWLVAPALMGIGAARVLTPWSGAMWPTRTALADATEARVHDIGRPLPLDVDLTRTDRGRGQTRVWASYRLRVPGEGGTAIGATRRVAMMWQARDEDEQSGDGGREFREPERYSWLHTDLAAEAAAVVGAGEGGEPPARGGSRPQAVEFEVEYWFETADAATAPARVLVVEPPMVESASLRVEPPAYVDLRVTGDLAYVAGTVDLGSGTDERAKVGPILEGSRVELAITFNKPLDEGLATGEGVLAGFGRPLAGFDPVVQIEGRTVRILAVLSVIENESVATADGESAEASSSADAGPVLGVGEGSASDAAAAPTSTIEIPVRIADRHGLRSERESMFRLVVGADQAPTASVTEPATDESVLATAVVPVTGEGIDDAGVASVALERQRATPPSGSEGASPEAVGAAQVFAESNRLDPHLRRRTVDAMLDLSTLGVRVGDEVWITARATDTYALGDRRREPARSAARRLRIISQTDLIDQIRQDLSGVREAAIRLDEAQARLIASVSASNATTETARAQAGVSASIEDQQRYVDRLNERIERNRLDDEPLSLLVQDVASTLDGAATASTSATARLDQAKREREARAGAEAQRSGSQQRSGGPNGQRGEQAGGEQTDQQQQGGEDQNRSPGEQGERGQSQSDQRGASDEQATERANRTGAEARPNADANDASDDAPIDEAAAEAIQQDQREVRDELQRLAALLDSGTDGWLVRREIERLIEEQQDLMRETREAGASTAGRDVASLSPQERTELERIAQRQQELAEAVQDAIDELSQRARDMQEVDAAQAAGMRAAAQTGRERQASQSLQQASQQISQNNTNSAGQQQQEALDALGEMLEDLDEGQRNRDEALQRVLASIVEAIDGLIADQEQAIGDLTAARSADARGVADAGVGLDRAMINIHANTLGVIDEIRTGYPELGGVSRILGSAASAQTDAISALRASPIAFEPASEGESLSLSRLREARAEAKRLEEEAARRENARIRRELRQAYRQALEQQVAIRGDVEPYVPLDLSRRQRAEVRSLGERQETLRVGLDTILRETKELADASVFRLAHARMDRLLLDASEALRAGRAERGVVARQQGTIEILQSIVQALDDSQSEQDPFSSAQGGGGGGGGGGGQEQPVIIPVHELRILRGMQEQALGLTRELDAAAGSAHPNEVAELAALQRSLAEEASALVQRMQQGPGGAPGVPAGGTQE